MDFSYWASSGQPWADILESCRRAEADGWHGVWVPDHFMPPPEGYGNEAETGVEPELAPVLEAWTLQAALAATVPRVRIGAMVSGNTYRHPAVLAKMAATVDHISGGRLVLGLGAGWQENEHRRYGIELGSPGVRSDRLEEACEIVHRLLAEPRVDFTGDHYRLDGAPAEPKPVGDRIPLLVGGRGEQRTLRTVARWADEWNAWGAPDDFRHLRTVVARHCDDAGRDPSAIRVSAAALHIPCDDEATATTLREALAHRSGLVGTIEQLRERVVDYADAGVDEIVVPDFNHPVAGRVETFDRFRAEVIDQLD
jgi:F420-dependent oxidoreductase-like protein